MAVKLAVGARFQSAAVANVLVPFAVVALKADHEGRASRPAPRARTATAARRVAAKPLTEVQGADLFVRHMQVSPSESRERAAVTAHS